MVDTATLFGRCVAAVRMDLGFTQAKFAEMLRISRPALTHVETGRATLSFHVLLRLGQKVADERQDKDATAVLALFHLSALALQREGVRVLNRPLREHDVLMELPRIDRVVGRIFDREFREYLEHAPHNVAQFAGDDDYDEFDED